MGLRGFKAVKVELLRGRGKKVCYGQMDLLEKDCRGKSGQG